MSHPEDGGHGGEPPGGESAAPDAQRLGETTGDGGVAEEGADSPSSPMSFGTSFQASSPATAPVRLELDLALLGDPDTDPEAHQREWRRLVEHYGPRLDGYFADRVPSQADRDDLLQHVWYKAVLHVRSLPNTRVLWNWLRKVGENRLTDLGRSAATAARNAEEHAAEVRHELESGGPQDDSADAERFEAGELEGELGRRVAALSDSDRQLVMLVIEKVPHEEIAARLGLPSAAASRQRWSRLRKSLRGA